MPNAEKTADCKVCYWKAHRYLCPVCVQLFFSFETIFTVVTLEKPSQKKLVFGSVLPERELICYVASVTGFAPSHPRFPARTVV